MPLRLLAATAVLLACTGCMGPEITLASYAAQALVKTAMDYQEANKPTPDELWAEQQLALLETQARAGDAEARYQLAQIHQAYERREATHWMCEAANAGHPKAMLQMGHWYNEDRRQEDQWPYVALKPNNRRSYVYYGLAARSGEPFARMYMDALAESGMPDREVEAAEREVDTWRPVTCPYVVAVREPLKPFDPTDR